jgi:integrase
MEALQLHSASPAPDGPEVAPAGMHPMAVELARDIRRIRELLDREAHVTPCEFVVAFEEFFVAYAPSLRWPDTLRHQLSVLRAHFAGRLVHEIKAGDVEAFTAARLAAGKQPSTTNRQRSLLMVFFGWCLKRGYCSSNVVEQVKRLRERNQRERYLTTEEFERLLQAAASSPARHLHAFIFAAVYLGARRRELLTLRWADVNFDNEYVTFRAEVCKTGRSRVVPLVPELAEVLRDLRARQRALEGDQEHIFTYRGRRLKTIDSGFVRACRAAKIEGLRVHDLRHSYASNFVAQGGSLFALQRLLGHSDPRMTNRYSHVAKDYLLEQSRYVGMPGRPRPPRPEIEPPKPPEPPPPIPAETIALLLDLRVMFTEERATYLTTQRILDRLSPKWPDLCGPKQATSQALGRLLRPVGVRPSQVGQHGRKGLNGCKGYRLGALAPAFARYL